MKLDTAIGLHATAAGGQTDSSSLIGRKYKVVDRPGYQHIVNEFNTPGEAEKAALARPYSAVITSDPNISQTPQVRDLARRRLTRVNPDVDSAGVPNDKERKRKKRKDQRG